MEILIINSGSSSLKYQLIDSKTGESKAKGIVDRRGSRSEERAIYPYSRSGYEFSSRTSYRPQSRCYPQPQ